MIDVNLSLDEVPIVSWLDSRMNQPPPGPNSWPPGGSYVSRDGVFSFDPNATDLLVYLLESYADMAENDPDTNPDSVVPAARLAEKILSAAAGR
jgi:hypothetical protein